MTTPSLPSLDELLSRMSVVTIPLHTRFRGVTHREVVVLTGPAGAGEFSPFLEYSPPEAARWLAAAIEAAWVGWPDPVREEVSVNATVPAVAPERVAEVLARFDGCRTAKVKVAEPGQSLGDDLARVAEVRQLMGPAAQVRVDANGGWSLDEAQRALAALAAHDLEYAEQPCASVEDLAALRLALARNGVDVRIAADESIRKAEDPLRVARLEAADVVVVKVAPLGGVRSALEVVEACGLPAVVSSALDTSVGIRAGVALAAALPVLDHACGLGTVNLLVGDVARDRQVPHGGSLEVRHLTVDEDCLARWAATADRAAWWRDRLIACHAVLSATMAR